ncbi:MAG: energy-coupling factor transporter ATPase [Clostridiales bacterium]|nr:energy-coupling factor transporter ATPase [Clostridiales bacterium]
MSDLSNDTIIEFENVSFSYNSDNNAKDNEVLHNINLSFKKGELVAVVGRNGSGKSTLAKLCNALYEPNNGRVIVNGIVSGTEKNDEEIRKHVGMVFQNPDNQIVATIVEDDVAFGPENLGIDPLEIRQRVDDALKKVGMYEYRLEQPFKLSGGQKQRVAIAGAIAMRTECIVFDEPTAMLDPLGRKEVLSAVRTLVDEYGITVILITHFMEEAAQADRVIVLNEGCVILDNTPEKVFSKSDLLNSIGLDIPQITKFCALLGLGNSVLTVDQAYDLLIPVLEKNS